MITDERITSYINSLNCEKLGVLGDIEREALEDEVPIVRMETRSFIRTLLSIKKPMKVLEVGTAVGFSAIYMSMFIPEGGHITTIENWAPRVVKARANFERTDTGDKITLIEGDATEVLHDLNEKFDLIFMDAAKGQYINFLPDVIRLMEDDGVLISDNVLQDGEVLDSKFVVERRNRTIHARMREYLYELTHNELLDTSVISIGDGVALSVKL
ncbi:MAG: O-methyltransferase [Lachnospiraceae bacterium]|nr:O-methyltransferase [Lachnospiraceae bacterium]